MSTNIHYLVTIIWLMSLQFLGYDGGAAEKKLLNHLFDTSRPDAYNVFERPVKTESDAVKVRMQVSLIQILKMDTKNSEILLNLWISMRWNDYHFKWNAKDYNGIELINIPDNKIWKPDIRLYNSVDDNLGNRYPINVIATNTGNIVWVPPGQYKANCETDVTYFPFDVSMCNLTFGSWTYSSRLLDLRMECPNEIGNRNCAGAKGLNVDYYNVNNEFELSQNSLTLSQFRYGNDSYPNYVFKFALRRNSRYYAVNFIIPCIVLSIMVLMVFVLPPASGEKVKLGVFVLAMLIALLLVIASGLPKSSKAIPLISKYLICLIILCGLSVLIAAIVLNLFHGSANEKKVPDWIRVGINSWLARILFMKIDEHSDTKDSILLQKYESSSSAKDNSEDKMAIIVEELLKISKKFSINDLQVALAKEWKFAARVVDRFCFVLFGIITVLSTFIFLTRSG